MTIKADFPVGTRPAVFLQERFREQLYDPRPYRFAEGSNIAIYSISKPKRNARYSIAWEQSFIRSLSPEIDDILPARMTSPIDDG
jgi:hypothetical protein